jgi:hypothetical protein
LMAHWFGLDSLFEQGHQFLMAAAVT